MFQLENLYENRLLKELLIRMREIGGEGSVSLSIYEVAQNNWVGEATISTVLVGGEDTSFPRFHIQVDSATPENAGVQLVGRLETQLSETEEQQHETPHVTRIMLNLARDMLASKYWCEFTTGCRALPGGGWVGRIIIHHPNSTRTTISTSFGGRYQDSPAHVMLVLLDNTLTASAREAVRLARQKTLSDMRQKIEEMFPI